MMTRIVQWNCKALRVRHKKVKLLMNNSQSSCICLQEVMLENVKFNLGREYKFYATTPRVRNCNSYKKGNSTQKTKHKNGPSGGGSGSLHNMERKRDNLLNISTPNRWRDMRNKFMKVIGNYKRRTIPPLERGGNIITSPDKIADTFADHFANVLRDPNKEKQTSENRKKNYHIINHL